MTSKKVYSFLLKDREIELLDAVLLSSAGQSINEKLKLLVLNAIGLEGQRLAEESKTIPEEPSAIDCDHFSRDPKDPTNFCYCRARHITLEYCLKTHRKAVEKGLVCSPPYMRFIEVKPQKPSWIEKVSRMEVHSVCQRGFRFPYSANCVACLPEQRERCTYPYKHVEVTRE